MRENRFSRIFIIAIGSISLLHQNPTHKRMPAPKQRRHFLLEAHMLTDARLSAILDMLPTLHTAADIGTDHGRLGAQLLLSEKCKNVWFTDISAPSLEKAKKLIGRLALEDRARFFVGDGAKALPESPDAAIIAGMGGVTISEILRSSEGKLDSSYLILQPNVAVYDVRKTLTELGFMITDERCVIAANRKYILIAARKGKAEYSESELIAGPMLLKNGGTEFLQYAAFRNRVLEKAIQGARKGENTEIDALIKEKAVWEEVLS